MNVESTFNGKMINNFLPIPLKSFKIICSTVDDNLGLKKQLNYFELRFFPVNSRCANIILEEHIYFLKGTWGI